MRKFLKKIVVWAGTLVMLVAAALLYFGSQGKIIPAAKVAVVLGNEVYVDGRPSPRLAARLDAALELYRNGAVQTIIVSGSVGKSRVDEATAMGAYLQEAGVPGSAIVVDPSGVNTWATAQFTAHYLRQNGQSAVIAVTQAFHIPRTVMALKAAGCPEAGQFSADYWEWRDIYSTLREIPAYFVYWWKYAD